MRLAIGTDDKETLPRKHFGESHYFCVVNVGAGAGAGRECRANPVTAHHGGGKRDSILQELKDCDALVARSFGASILSVPAGKEMQVILTTLVRVDDVITAFQNGAMRPFKRFDPHSDKFVPMEG